MPTWLLDREPFWCAQRATGAGLVCRVALRSANPECHAGSSSQVMIHFALTGGTAGCRGMRAWGPRRAMRRRRPKPAGKPAADEGWRAAFATTTILARSCAGNGTDALELPPAATSKHSIDTWSPSELCRIAYGRTTGSTWPRDDPATDLGTPPSATDDSCSSSGNAGRRTRRIRIRFESGDTHRLTDRGSRTFLRLRRCGGVAQRDLRLRDSSHDTAQAPRKSRTPEHFLPCSTGEDAGRWGTTKQDACYLFQPLGQPRQLLDPSQRSNRLHEMVRYCVRYCRSFRSARAELMVPC